MRAIKMFKIKFSTIFLVFSVSTLADSLPPFSPKIWLSEYGYSIDTSKEIGEITFPVDQHNNSFNNSFLSKTETEVVVHGNLSFIVFTCEAEYPVSWFVNQEMKYLSEILRTRTYEFQTTTNLSKNTGTYFRSLIYTDFDPMEYDYPRISSGNWRFSCHKTSSITDYCRGSSITVNLENNLSTEISTKKYLNIEEKIIMVILAKEPNTSIDNFSSDLILVREYYQNFDNQSVMLGTNYTMNISDDTILENTKLVEYDHGKPLKDGDLIQILCFSNEKLYSNGGYVEILMENGTEIRLSEENNGLKARSTIYLSDNSKLLQRKLFSPDHSAELEIVYFLSKEIKVELGMKQINCYMPVWIDGTWERLVRKISVFPK